MPLPGEKQQQQQQQHFERTLGAKHPYTTSSAYTIHHLMQCLFRWRRQTRTFWQLAQW
jgi:hypothetical protein